ncbi:MAG: hypothetical protein ACKOEX_00315 [Planctomycetia bacterium]
MSHPPQRSLKIGLLGVDSSIAEVAEAARCAGDAITIACDLPDDASWPNRLGAIPPRSSSWTPLLDDETCDAVLVGRDGWSDARAEAVRGLVQGGRTLLLSHPLSLSMLWAYEIDMIRADSRARLIPMLPDRLHPFIARLKNGIETAMADAHPAGPIETITLERRMSDRSREAVLGQFARDVDLVRALVGDPHRLATLGGTIDTAWPTLAVGLTGPRNVTVRWNVARGDRPQLTITLLHARGSTTVTATDDDPRWAWSDESGEPKADGPAFDRGQVMLAELHRAAGHPLDLPSQRNIPPADWSDAARAVELAETVPRSLAKGRAVDLHQEEFSEIGTFKGTMASLGCGIVLAALFILVLAALVGGIAREAGWGIGERIAGAWPIVVLTALVLFLVLQLLPLLVGGADASPPGAGAGSEPRPPRP